MASLNKVLLLGHLTHDPEVRYTPNGTAVATFGLASNHRYRQGEEQKDDVCFVDVVTFGRQAETVCDYLHKGSPALVEGRLRWRSWESADGQKRSKHEVLAERVQFLPSPAAVRADEREAAELPEMPLPEDSDIPF
jgi:single-strand DNA-binding protein